MWGIFRSEEKARPFREKYSNLEIVTGIDASQPKSLKPAFEGADSALIVTTFDPTKGFAEDAALNSKFVLLTFSHFFENSSIALSNEISFRVLYYLIFI